MERKQPHIDYPCNWDYIVMGVDEQQLRIAVAGVVGNVPYVLSLANRSRNARYLSLHLTLEVRDEAQRLGIFDDLRRHPDIRFVL